MANRSTIDEANRRLALIRGQLSALNTHEGLSVDQRKAGLDKVAADMRELHCYWQGVLKAAEGAP